jgi:uncharacterized repeat protein (TIGR03803 family)
MRLVVAVALLVSGRFLQAGSLTVLHSFAGPPNDGSSGINVIDDASGSFALVQASDGNFYGTTPNGGVNDGGCFFKMDSAGTVTVLYSFGSLQHPNGVIQASDGFFYGTTLGTTCCLLGTAFKIDSAGVFTNLHTFGPDPDGSFPEAGLVEGTDGNFYGTTSGGGAHGGGTVFKMTPSGTVTILHSFALNVLGVNPSAALIQASDGLFYGTTQFGGTHGHGSIFKITSTGTFTRLHSFNNNDGAQPIAPLVQASDGNFYGTTSEGGSHGVGVIFKVNSSGNFNVLVNLTNNAQPDAGLIQLPNGLLYGTTALGGKNHDGAIFKVDPSNGNYARIFSFSGGDGSTPEGRLLLGTDGLLYGTTEFGGASDLGVVFSFSTPIALPAMSETSVDGDLSAEDQ